jgi:SAM-dependent methyltransferase
VRQRLLDFIVCPRCRSRFRLHAAEARDEDVITATLECDGGHEYPVLKGIPRLLPATSEAEDFDPDIAATQRSFSSEWSVLAPTDRAWGLDIEARRRMFLDCFAIDPAALAGKTVLDVGCGHGEVELALEGSGAEVFAMELSSSIDDLPRRLERQAPDWRDRVHLLQGSVDRLPFAPGAFDLVQSAGVLHHTPDTRAAFGNVAAAVRPGGACFIEVYSAERKNRLAHEAARLVRVVSVRLPHPLLHGLCFAGAPLAWAFTRAWNAAAGEDVYRRRTVREMELSLFDGFSPRYAAHHTTEEVLGWFAAEGFAPVRRTFVNKNGFGILGVKNTHER